jgi:hypothetical protein
MPRPENLSTLTRLEVLLVRERALSDALAASLLSMREEYHSPMTRGQKRLFAIADAALSHHDAARED